MKKLQARSRPRQERSRKRVDYILDTAEKLVMELGYESVTAQMISQHTNISPGVIYHYFPGKHSIFAAVAQRAFQRLELRMQVLYAEAAPDNELPELINNIVDDLAKYWLENKGELIMWQALEHSPRMNPITSVIKEKAVERNSSLIKIYFPELKPAEVRIKAIIMEEICFCLLRQLFTLKPNDARRLIAELKSMLINLLADMGNN